MNSEGKWDLDRVRAEVARIKLDLSSNPPSKDTYLPAFKSELECMPVEWRGFALEMFNMGYDFGVDMRETNRIAMQNQQRREFVLLGVGLVLLILGIVLAFTVKNPTTPQQTLIALIAALGAAAFIVMLPGFLELQGVMAPNLFFHSMKFKGGGGAAIFILVFVLMHFFFNH